jgi:hypothetical protein
MDNPTQPNVPEKKQIRSHGAASIRSIFDNPTRPCPRVRMSAFIELSLHRLVRDFEH